MLDTDVPFCCGLGVIVLEEERVAVVVTLDVGGTADGVIVDDAALDDPVEADDVAVMDAVIVPDAVFVPLRVEFAVAVVDGVSERDCVATGVYGATAAPAVKLNFAKTVQSAKVPAAARGSAGMHALGMAVGHIPSGAAVVAFISSTTVRFPPVALGMSQRQRSGLSNALVPKPRVTCTVPGGAFALVAIAALDTHERVARPRMPEPVLSGPEPVPSGTATVICVGGMDAGRGRHIISQLRLTSRRPRARYAAHSGPPTSLHILTE